MFTQIETRTEKQIEAQIETDATPGIVNGLNLEALGQAAAAITADPRQAQVAFSVSSSWQGGLRTSSKVESYTLAGQQIDRSFELHSDEPSELLGTNSAPNPQELLLTALNSCMMVGYVAGATQRGITLSRLEIRSEAGLDLRGAFGLDPEVARGCPEVRLKVVIAGAGTPEQFEEIHQEVQRNSPNYWNVTRPVPVRAELEIR